MPSPRNSLLAVVAVAVILGCAGSAGVASANPSSARPATDPAAGVGGQGFDDPLYTEAQARRGEAVYDKVCVECHTLTEFTERPFLFAWEGTSVGQLYTYVAENMPDDGPGSLPAGDYLDAMAYILEMNGYPAGEEELTDDLERMRAVPFERRPGSHP